MRPQATAAAPLFSAPFQIRFPFQFVLFGGKTQAHKRKEGQRGNGNEEKEEKNTRKYEKRGAKRKKGKRKEKRERLLPGAGIRKKGKTVKQEQAKTRKMGNENEAKSDRILSISGFSARDEGEGVAVAG